MYMFSPTPTEIFCMKPCSGILVHSLFSSQSTFDTTYVLTGLQPYILYTIELRVENQYSVRMTNGDDGFGPPVRNRTSEGGERVMTLLVNCQSKLASFPGCPPTSKEVKQEGILVDIVAWVYTLTKSHGIGASHMGLEQVTWDGNQVTWDGSKSHGMGIKSHGIGASHMG